jgi:hypothetical protein
MAKPGVSRGGRAIGARPGRRPTILLIGGLASIAVAALHAAVIYLGAPAYRWFGAGETLARMAEAGSPVPALLTGAIALAFLAFAAYGFAGARVLPRLPRMRIGLLVAAGAYLVRGLPALPQGMALMASPDAVPLRALAFSAVSLTIGICYAMGTGEAWDDLGGGAGGRRSGSGRR